MLPLSTALLAVGGITVVLLILALAFGPIIRYYFWRSFVPWSSKWLERIAAAYTRYEEYWDPDAPTSAAVTAEDVQS